MILFKNDWDYYPTAIVDDSTKNISWLKYAHLLEKIGVSNYYFPLALIDPTLKGVDPFSPDLTLDQGKRIILECKNNVWYFLREVVRVPAKASPFPSMYSANRGNVGLFFLALNDIDVGITQIRQTGKTLGCNILLTYIATCIAQNSTIQLMTRSGKLRGENVAALKEIRKLLPSYVGNISKKDSDNTEGVTYVNMGNKLLTALPQSDPEAAISAGRGFTSPIIMIDEPVFCTNIHYSYPAMMSSSNAASDEARRANMPTFKLFPCTAGDLGREEGRFMYDIYHSVCRWKEHFFDATNKEELQEIIRNGSRKRRLMCYIEFNHRQLGYSDEWLYEKIVESAGSVDDVNKDYFNQWSSGSGKNPLDPQIREAISKSSMEPVWVERGSNNYIINWYISKTEVDRAVNTGVKFIIGMDTSEGIGNDNMTMIFIHEHTLETVASCCIGSAISTIKYCDFVCKTMLKYPNTVLIPERRSTGIVVIDHLLIQLPTHGIDPFTRIYNKVVSGGEDVPATIREIYTKPLNRRHITEHEKCKAYFGFTTSSSGINSRRSLYELTFPRISNYAADSVRDPELISELMSLIVDERGRIDHAASGHDDNVIAWLLAGWLLCFGRNLSTYGIHSPLINAKSHTERHTENKESKKETYERKQQENIKYQLATLLSQLSESEGDIQAIFIEKRIRKLKEHISQEYKLPLSVDELIREANNIRKNRLLNTNIIR